MFLHGNQTEVLYEEAVMERAEIGSQLYFIHTDVVKFGCTKIDVLAEEVC